MASSQHYLTEEVPPELILILGGSLSTSALKALLQTCRRLHTILQPELEARITPELGRELLILAAGKPAQSHLGGKLLAPPHNIHPSSAALEAAVNAGSVETTRLLLDHGANVNEEFDYDEDGTSYALYDAISRGNIDMVELLLSRGANTELRSTYGSALGCAVRRRRLDIIRLLLRYGAKAEVRTPLNPGWMCGGPPPPHRASLLYLVLALKHPRGKYTPRPVPVEGREEIMALLMASGASKDGAMKTVKEYLSKLAEAAEMTEWELLNHVEGLFEVAERLVTPGASAYRA